jgi:5-enolpyruvylshikimate-3-phosphate synthase
MALAVAGLAAQGPVTVAGAQVVAESFPQFAQVLRQLGAEVETWDENDTALD